jgi:N utilization substance protein A
MVGERIRAYLKDVQRSSSEPGVILSRAAPEFVKALFCIEVAEIADGIVEVMGVARDAGYRTKIAVRTLDEKVDPIGACVGQRGSRVKNVVRELNGERIDIVRWFEDPRNFAAEALQPAQVSQSWVDANNPNVLQVVVEPDQYSLAIGRRGQNVRLASELIGYQIEITKTEVEASFEEQVAEAIADLAAIDSIGEEYAEALVEKGFLTVDGIMALSLDEFREAVELDMDTAEAIWNAAASFAKQGEDND